MGVGEDDALVLVLSQPQEELLQQAIEKAREKILEDLTSEEALEVICVDFLASFPS